MAETMKTILPSIIKTVQRAVIKAENAHFEDIEYEMDIMKNVIGRDRVLVKMAHDSLQQEIKKKLQIIWIKEHVEETEQDLVNAVSHLMEIAGADAGIISRAYQIGKMGSRRRPVIGKCVIEKNRADLVENKMKLGKDKATRIR